MIHDRGDALFAGGDEAGLFRSDDGGDNWQPVAGLNDHPTRRHGLPAPAACAPTRS